MHQQNTREEFWWLVLFQFSAEDTGYGLSFNGSVLLEEVLVPRAMFYVVLMLYM